MWGGFEDGLVPAGAEAIAAIDEVIAATGAQLVYTHAPDDTHQDHRSTSIASLAAARRVSTVLYYETPSTQHFQPTLFVDVDNTLDVKMQLLRAHRSQVLRDGPVNLDAIVAQARFRGSQSRVLHAEAFETARFVWDLVPAATGDATLNRLAEEPRAVVARGRGHRPGDPGAGRVSAGRHSGPTGAPWTLLGLLGIALLFVAAFGVKDTSAIVVVCARGVVPGLPPAPPRVRRRRRSRRHASTCAAPGASTTGTARVSRVMVPCRNEELVVEGMVTCLLALDYPRDLLELLVIDDGSDDATGADPRRARPPRPAPARASTARRTPAAASRARSTLRWSMRRAT